MFLSEIYVMFHFLFRTSRSKLIDSSPKEDRSPPKPAQRRLIKVDFSQFEDEDEEDADNTPESTEPGLWSNEANQVVDGTLEAYDLATQEYYRSGGRRSTLEVNDSNMGAFIGFFMF